MPTATSPPVRSSQSTPTAAQAARERWANKVIPAAESNASTSAASGSPSSRACGLRAMLLASTRRSSRVPVSGSASSTANARPSSPSALSAACSFATHPARCRSSNADSHKVATGERDDAAQASPRLARRCWNRCRSSRRRAYSLLEGGVLGGDALDGVLGPFSLKVTDLPEQLADAIALQQDLRAGAERSAGSHVDEPAVVALERYGHRGGRAVPVLGHDQVRLPRAGRLRLVLVLTVQHDHDVAVLLDRTGFTQVREEGALVGALLWAAVELRDGDHRDLDLLGQELE